MYVCVCVRVCVRVCVCVCACVCVSSLNFALNLGTADFDVGPSQITFPVGVRMLCFDVPILEDDITEGDNEIFEIIATPSVGGSPTVISICIRDNDSKISSIYMHHRPDTYVCMYTQM